MKLPEQFINQINNMFGSEVDAFISALAQPSPISIRLNPSKASGIAADCYKELNHVPWASNAFYLAERPVFTLDPLFHAGTYYVQEAASMFVEQAVEQHLKSRKGLNVLDLCAAPGGKFTHLLSLFSEDCLLVANEAIRGRAGILHENVCKWGYPNVVVTNNAAKDFARLPNFFDVMLVDAPCSGEGMFRKDATAVEEWSEANVALCAERQQKILADAWPALKSGGLLIYSTCTYNRKENEENVKWLVDTFGAQSLPLHQKGNWGIVESKEGDCHGYHFYPHRTKSEGLFIAVLRKGAGENDISTSRVKSKPPVRLTKELEPFCKLVNESKAWGFTQYGSMMKAIPADKLSAVMLVEQNLHIVSSGLALGELKGRDFIPSAALALSVDLASDSFPSIEVDLNTALHYLRREPIDAKDAEKGFVLVTYKGVPLGWIKNIGSRSNNLYPSEWRIRMEIKK